MTYTFCTCPFQSSHCNTLNLGPITNKDVNTIQHLLENSGLSLKGVQLQDITPVHERAQNILTRESNEFEADSSDLNLNQEYQVGYTATLSHTRNIGRETIDSALRGMRDSQSMPPFFINLGVTVKERNEDQNYTLYLEIIKDITTSQTRQNELKEELQSVGDEKAEEEFQRCFNIACELKELMAETENDPLVLMSKSQNNDTNDAKSVKKGSLDEDLEFNYTSQLTVCNIL